MRRWEPVDFHNLTNVQDVGIIFQINNIINNDIGYTYRGQVVNRENALAVILAQQPAMGREMTEQKTQLRWKPKNGTANLCHDAL